MKNILMNMHTAEKKKNTQKLDSKMIQLMPIATNECTNRLTH